MRHLLSIIIAAIALLGLTAIAGAESYTVRKGDTLSRIALKAYGNAKSWPRIHQANPKIKNPDRIYPNQKLEIPASAKQQPKAAKTAKAAASPFKATAGTFDRAVIGVPFMWKNVGGNPFGKKRDHVKALGKLPEKDKVLKELFIRTYLEQTPDPIIIPQGKEFDHLLFGNYKWEGHGFWVGKKKGEDLPGLAWPEFEYKGRLYQLWLCIICNNLGISSRPVPPPPPAPPAEPVVPPTPPVEPPPAVAPPAPPAEPPAVAPPAPPAECPTCQWAPDWKGSLFIAPRWGTRYPSTDKIFIYGGEMDIFPGYCGDKDRMIYPGLSIKGVGWDGQFGEKNGGVMDLYGRQIVAGGVLEIRQPNDLSIFHLRYGEQYSKFWNNTGYDGEEKTDILNAEARHLHKTGHDFPSEWQLAVNADIDMGGEKKSSVKGRTLTRKEDPRQNQNHFSFLAQASLYADPKFEPLVGVVADWTPDAKVYAGVEPYVGAKMFEEQIELSARFRKNIGEDDPSPTTGFNGVWNVDRTLKKVGAYATKWWANRGVEEAQAVAEGKGEAEVKKAEEAALTPSSSIIVPTPPIPTAPQE